MGLGPRLARQANPYKRAPFSKEDRIGGDRGLARSCASGVSDTPLQRQPASLAATTPAAPRSFRSKASPLPAVARGRHHAETTLLAGHLLLYRSLNVFFQVGKLPHVPSPWACWCAGKQIMTPMHLLAGPEQQPGRPQRWEMQQPGSDKGRWASGGPELGKRLFLSRRVWVRAPPSDGIAASTPLHVVSLPENTRSSPSPCLCPIAFLPRTFSPPCSMQGSHALNLGKPALTPSHLNPSQSQPTSWCCF